MQDQCTNRDLRCDEVNEHITLTQLSDGLTFGTDAYLLAAYVKAKKNALAADLGSGTGIIPLLCLSRNKFAFCTAAEIQSTFCDLIKKNAADNGFEDRLSVYAGDIRNLSPSLLGRELDIVTANPPYMAVGSGVGNQAPEKYAARHEINGGIQDFCAAAGRLLKHGGKFYCVFRPERLGDLLQGLRKASLEPKRMTFVHATVGAQPSMLLMEATQGAAPSLICTPPLILWESGKDDPSRPTSPMVPTTDSVYIYENCAFPPSFLGGNRSK